MDKTLTHHGILGMKWGVRRTPSQLGKSSKPKTYSPKNKKASQMTAKELERAIARLKLEKQYNDLSKTTISKGMSAVAGMSKQIMTIAAAAAVVRKFYGPLSEAIISNFSKHPRLM